MSVLVSIFQGLKSESYTCRTDENIKVTSAWPAVIIMIVPLFGVTWFWELEMEKEKGFFL